MNNDSTLFESVNGSILRGFLLLRQDGKNVPPNWVNRYRDSRQKKEAEIAKLLKAGSIEAVNLIAEWEEIFRKEAFYTGIRLLFELQRGEKSKA